MITCPNCGRDNEDHYKFCLGCGTVLPRPEAKPPAAATPKLIDCPHCGSEVPSNFRFCGSCGGAIAAAAPAKAEPAPAPAPTPVAAPSPSPPVAAAPAPAAARSSAYLVVIKPDGSEGARVSLGQGEAILGRSSAHDVLSSDPFLSPSHASVAYVNGGYTVTDLGSLNGVFLRIRQEIELQDGDQIRVGQELLEFHKMAAVAPLVAKTGETLTGGSPDAGYWGRMALISGPEVETRAFLFAADEVTIGREVGDVLFRDDGFVSGRHARVAKVDSRVFLKDLGSSNGTYIRIREAHRIEPGDLILMGQQLFKLVEA